MIEPSIGVGSVVKAKVIEMEENTTYKISRGVSKEAVRCVQALLGKKKLLGQFEYGQKREISSIFILCLCSKE